MPRALAANNDFQTNHRTMLGVLRAKGNCLPATILKAAFLQDD